MRQQITEPLSFTFSGLIHRFPPGRAHILKDEGLARSDTWCREYLVDLVKDMEAYLAEQCGLIAAYVHPDALPAQYAVINDCYQLYGAVDNVLDAIDPQHRDGSAARSMVQSLLETVGSEQKKVSGLPFISAVVDVNRRIMSLMTDPQQGRYLESMQEYFLGCAAEDPFWQNEGPQDLQTLMDVHMLTGTRLLVPMMAEFGLGVDMSGPLLQSHALRSASDLSIRFVLLANDLFSYRKERFHGTLAFNAIDVFMRSEGLPLQESVDRLIGHLNACENEFYATYDEVLATPLGQREDVRRYLHGLEMIAAGTIQWYFNCGRYNGAGHVWNGTTSGTMILHPERTEYLPFPAADCPGTPCPTTQHRSVPVQPGTESPPPIGDR